VLLAVFFVAAALALTLTVRHLAARAYFILFVPAVMFASWFGGRLSGMLASGLSIVGAFLLLSRAEVVEQSPWLLVAGLVTFGMSMLTDLRRRAETQLMTRVEEELSRRRTAESLSELKTEALVEVAHELRQPLSAITTAARLLDSAAPESARRRAIAVVGRQAEYLRLLTEDLLDLSKMTRRELQLRMSNFDLREVIDDSVNVIAPDVAARRIELSSSIPSCPIHLTADPTRVRQILSNLLANAVKFTPEGGKIDVTVEHTPAHVVMRVRDSGRGIAPESLPLVFDLFHKGDSEASGLGIGLAVVKGLAEMHGGVVEVRSAGIDQGSEFVVKLPAMSHLPMA
jgi:signal transduction histidine kinase